MTDFLKKIKIKPEHLFGLIEVDFANNKIVLHKAACEEGEGPIEVVVKAALAANIQMGIEMTIDLINTMVDMAEDEARQVGDEDDEAISQMVEGMSEEETERMLEASKGEVQKIYDEQMSMILRKNGKLN